MVVGVDVLPTESTSAVAELPVADGAAMILAGDRAASVACLATFSTALLATFDALWPMIWIPQNVIPRINFQLFPSKQLHGNMAVKTL